MNLLRILVLVIWPDGGQGTARRNAWTAMAADAKRARQRAEAAAFIDAVAAVHVAPDVTMVALHG